VGAAFFVVRCGVQQQKARILKGELRLVKGGESDFFSFSLCATTARA